MNRYIFYNCIIGKGHKRKKPSVDKKKLYKIFIAEGETVEDTVRSVQYRSGYKLKSYSVKEIGYSDEAFDKAIEEIKEELKAKIKEERMTTNENSNV